VELKRKLTALAKRMNPQIEAYTIARAIEQSIKRIDELMTYAQEKLDRSEQKKRDKELTLGQQEDDRRKAAAAEVLATQNAESDENLADQQESFEERNKLAAKTKPPEATPASDTLPDDEASPIVDPADEPTKRVVKDPPKKKAKKKSSKKK